MDDPDCRVASTAANYLQDKEHWTQRQYTNVAHAVLPPDVTGAELAYASMEPDCRVCMIGSLIYACKQHDIHVRGGFYSRLLRKLNDYTILVTGAYAADYNDHCRRTHDEVADVMRGFAEAVCSNQPIPRT